MLDWSSYNVVNIIFRLLGVRGIGNVQANKILFAVKDSVANERQLETAIMQFLREPEKREMFMKPLKLELDPSVGFITILDELRYPESLRKMLQQNSPVLLSYMGNVELLKLKKVGFSGARKVSEKGAWITEDSTKQLAEDNVCVVSGYANGVDFLAHRTALQNGASTIMVLPEGIGSFYIKRELKDVWDWRRVLVVSEFMPHDKWMASRAMKRNMTIIGLSDSMVVVEAGTKGGSLDAGMKTIQMGKTLFVPLYQHAPESALGNSILVKHGAKTLGRSRETLRTNVHAVIRAVEHPAPQSLFG